MSRRYFFICLILFSLILIGRGNPQNKLTFNQYHQSDQVLSILESWKSRYPELTKLITIGKSAGNKSLSVLQIAAYPDGSNNPDSRPAVFVSANLQGLHHIGTEAALMLAQKLLFGYKSDNNITDLLTKRTIYIAPLLNPDAALNFFSNPKYERFSNNTPIDDDGDNLTDEDGPEDLNKDGFITQMRVKDPNGNYIINPQEPRLMEKAVTKNSGSVYYNIFSEGNDNDRDGKYNEDPAGGIDLNQNFQLNYEYYPKTPGRQPSSEKETKALLEFLFDHPNIALVLNFATNNNSLNLQQTGKNPGSGDKIQLPQNIAGMLELDPKTDYSLKDIIGIMERKKIIPPGKDNNREVLTLLSELAGTVKIDRQDIPLFNSIQKRSQNRLKGAGLNYSENNWTMLKKGSFAAFCYFRYGTFIFSTNLWSIPEKNDPTAAAGKHPDSYILNWSDTIISGTGFINWQPYKHPKLGSVEIGGFVPFININPPPGEIEKILSIQSDFFVELIGDLAELQIKETVVNRIKAGFYRITVSFTNPGWFPTSSAQGRKAGTSLPITVRLKTGKDQEIYSGEPFEILQFIGGSGDIKKLEWTIKAKQGSIIILTAESPKIGAVKSIIELK